MDQVAVSLGKSLPAPGRADSTAHLRIDTTISSTTDTTTLSPADSALLSDTNNTPQTWFAADSMGLVYRGSENPLFRYTKDPSEVFGVASVIVTPVPLREKAPHPLMENPVFQSFVLLLAATYIFLLYRHLNDIAALFSRILHTPSSGKRFSDEQKGIAFSRFLNIATAIGMLFAGVVAVKTGDILLPSGETGIFSERAALIMSLLATAAFSIIVLYQLSVIRLSGMLTLSLPLTSQLTLLKRIYFALTVIVISPVLLLYALCPPGTGRIWLYTILIELAVMALLYLGKTLNLFLSKKISILHWFLYLCTIEIFPFSLLWLIVAR